MRLTHYTVLTAQTKTKINKKISVTTVVMPAVSHVFKINYSLKFVYCAPDISKYVAQQPPFTSSCQEDILLCKNNGS